MRAWVTPTQSTALCFGVEAAGSILRVAASARHFFFSFLHFGISTTYLQVRLTESSAVVQCKI